MVNLSHCWSANKDAFYILWQQLIQASWRWTVVFLPINPDINVLMHDIPLISGLVHAEVIAIQSWECDYSLWGLWGNPFHNCLRASLLCRWLKVCSCSTASSPPVTIQQTLWQQKNLQIWYLCVCMCLHVCDSPMHATGPSQEEHGQHLLPLSYHTDGHTDRKTVKYRKSQPWEDAGQSITLIQTDIAYQQLLDGLIPLAKASEQSLTM